MSAERVRKSAGPLVVSIAPSGLDEHRLGLSVGRRVGSAVLRNRIKRSLRESFRHARDQLPRPTGGAEAFAYGWYVALVFGPLYNFFAAKLG